MVIYNVYKTFADISKTRDGDNNASENELRNVFAEKFFGHLLQFLKEEKACHGKTTKRKNTDKKQSTN